MCTMTFQLPAGVSPDLVRELERSCIAGGPDNMPYPTQVNFQNGSLVLNWVVEDSGYLVAPWHLPSIGTLMGTSATLMNRSRPYDLIVELTRGKLNQVRSQCADWQAGGLVVTNGLLKAIHDASLVFGRAVCNEDPTQLRAQSQQSLEMAYRAGAQLVDAYIQQVFQIRHGRQDTLETALCCRVDASVKDPVVSQRVIRAFNRVSIPMSWHLVEAEEASYNWQEIDALLNWAESNQIDVMAGPLIDFSSAQLPAWLWLWERDLPSMATFMCRFVEAAVRRYRTRIRRWHLTAASNWANVLGLTEEELLSLTYRLGETAQQVDSSLDLIVGVSQPWGEYMVQRERISPFIFADNLIRSGLKLAGLNLEVVMGVNGRGCYVRDQLELSRLLDLYALLTIPLHLTIGYPHASRPDPEADPELTVGGGTWRTGFTPDVQANWAEMFASLALCKPYVQAVNWTHVSDQHPHQFPNCGLLDHKGLPLPTFDVLESLRLRHLH